MFDCLFFFTVERVVGDPLLSVRILDRMHAGVGRAVTRATTGQRGPDARAQAWKFMLLRARLPAPEFARLPVGLRTLGDWFRVTLLPSLRFYACRSGAQTYLPIWRGESFKKASIRPRPLRKGATHIRTLRSLYSRLGVRTLMGAPNSVWSGGGCGCGGVRLLMLRAFQ